MLTDTGLPQRFNEIINYNNCHKEKYPEFAEKINFELLILKTEFEKFPTINQDQVINSYNKIENLLTKFDEIYQSSDQGDIDTKPFDYVRGILPLIDQYI